MSAFGRILFLLCAVAAFAAGQVHAGAAAAAPAELKPIDAGEIAYTNGIFTADGLHFVYAVLPKANAQSSELRAVDIKTGKVDSLGLVPLLQPEKKDQNAPPQPGLGAGIEFRWSLGVLGAENDLSTVYLAQYGPNEDLDYKIAIAWGIKEKAPLQVKHMPDLAALHKQQEADAAVKLTLNELDADAVKLRKEYQPLAKVVKLVGKKQLVVDAAPPIEATDAFRGLYERAVKDYPTHQLGNESGNLLCSDSVRPLAKRGNWVFAVAEGYFHYGIHGCGYQQMLLVDVKNSKVTPLGGVTGHTASGVRTGPLDNLFLMSSVSGAVAGISGGRLFVFRLPAE